MKKNGTRIPWMKLNLPENSQACTDKIRSDQFNLLAANKSVSSVVH